MVQNVISLYTLEILWMSFVMLSSIAYAQNMPYDEREKDDTIVTNIYDTNHNLNHWFKLL